jgi:predicted TIM-barrel enzyme
MSESRTAILERLRAKVAAGKPIIGGGAGTGLSAKCEEAGGIDLIVIYNSGRFRMAGRGSLAGLMPYGNANDIVKEMACCASSSCASSRQSASRASRTSPPSA